MSDDNKIQETLGRILGNWGMLMIEPMPSVIKGTFTHEGPLYRASLEFKGPQNGRYELICQERFARNLAGNILGTDADAVSVDDSLEVLMELINITSGNLVTAMYGDDTVYTLSPPQVSVVKKDIDTDELEAHVIAVFSGDVEPVGFLYFPDKQSL